MDKLILDINKLQSLAGNTLILKKPKLHEKFHFWLTLLLILSILTSSFLGAFSESKYLFQKNSPNWISKIKNIIDLGSNIDAEFDYIELEMESSLSPVTGFLLNKNSVSKDLNRVKNILKNWVAIIKPITQYTFDSRGFVSKANNNYITDDLDSFFSKAKDLLVQTKNVYNDFWLYRDLAFFIGKGNWVTTLGSFIDLTDSLISNKQTILDLLGQQTSQKIVIFNQNTGEARPTGGFFGSYIPINLSRGRITIGQSQSIYYVDGNKKDHFYTHPASWYYDYLYGNITFGDIRNTNFFPCFSDSAEFLESEFEQSNNGYSIDQVLMINPQLLENILPLNFTIQVSEDLILNPKNIMLEIERLTALEDIDPSNPKAKLTKILNSLFSSIPDIVSQIGLGQIVTILLQAFQARDIQIWSKDSDQRKFLNTIGSSSDKVCANQYPNKQILTFLLANISGDKRSLITDNQFNISSKNVPNGVRFNFKYKQILPNNPGQLLQRGFNRYNNISFVGLQIPDIASELDISSPQAIKTTFIREYYKNQAEDMAGSKLRSVDKINTILSTSRDLYSTDGSIPGFVYTQPDYSQVLGIYISDAQISTVDFSFTLPRDKLNLEFFNQPGLRNGLLSLGSGLYFTANSDSKVEGDYYTLASGVKLGVE